MTKKISPHKPEQTPPVENRKDDTSRSGYNEKQPGSDPGDKKK